MQREFFRIFRIGLDPSGKTAPGWQDRALHVARSQPAPRPSLSKDRMATLLVVGPVFARITAGGRDAGGAAALTRPGRA
jgi:hypothetical protein